MQHGRAYLSGQSWRRSSCAVGARFRTDFLCDVEADGGTVAELVFSVALNGYDKAFKRCLESHEAYAERIGADHFTALRPVVPDPAYAAWMKLTLILSAFDHGYDHVAYIDADCEVRASTPSFVGMLDRSERPILMANGRTGRINSGVIFARADHVAAVWLRSVVESVTENISDEDRANLRFENGNVIALERRLNGVGELPPIWNNTFDPEMDDFIRHFTGPLKPLYRRPPSQRLIMELAKLKYPRARSAPPFRSPQFLADLEKYTARAWESKSN